MILPVSTTSVHILPELYTFFGLAKEGLFGGNILASRGDLVGRGSYDEAIEGLNVNGLRYPGGALTEEYFDITNPDASTVTSALTGETSDFIPISDFLAYAGANGQDVTIVVPTRGLVSEAPNSSEDLIHHVHHEELTSNLRGFVHDLTTGVYGDANIVAIEVGNEYWGSGGMNAVEYGHVASEMAWIINDELKLVSEEYGIDTSGIGVLVQSGYNFGTSRISNDYEGWESHDVIDDLLDQYPQVNLSYDNIRNNGDVNWTEVNNELIIMAFDTPEKLAAVHGVLGHVYTYGTEHEDAGAYQLSVIEDTWLNLPGFENAEIHVTEWNQKSTDGLDNNADYGLFQAHEMLHIVENFIEAGVDQAYVWPLIQNTSNALSTGMEYSGPTAPGQFFAMMSENLPGKAVIDFTPEYYRGSEYEAGTADVHAFAGRGEMVFYLASIADETTVTYIDLSNYVAGFEAMEVSVLGVVPEQSPGDNHSNIEIQQLEATEVYQDGILAADLDQGEIMQVIIRGIQPTDAFAPTLEAIEAADVVIDDEDPIIDDDPVEEEPPNEDTLDDGGFGDGLAGLGFLLGLLPILLLLGMA
jgi:hypothetical protein